MTAQSKSVLISGASVAGPSLAFWLSRFGYGTTIVERTPELRESGYAVDFRGTAVGVLHQMGLFDAIEARATHMGPMHYVNGRDRIVATLPALAFSGEIEIMRGDLASILYDATRERTRYLFGDSISEISDDPDGVDVLFDSGRRERFDLVIGADGQHSNVRAKAFGPERDFVKQLGLKASIFTVPNRLNLDYCGRIFNAPGSVAGLYSARQNTEARALLFFNGTPDAYDYRDVAAQKRMVKQRYAGQGWHVPQILADLDNAPDFYFNSVCQIHVPCWHKDRVALLGDAGYCASPLSGMGTSMAVTGAFMLAHELASAEGNHQAAFAAYQARLQPFVAASQALALKAVTGFAPRTDFAIRLRNMAMKLLPLMPANMIVKEANAAANAVSVAGYGRG